MTLVALLAAFGWFSAAGGRGAEVPLLAWAGFGAMLGAGLLCWVRVVPRAFVEAAGQQSGRFATVLDNMPQGLSFFDGSGRLVVCNRRYVELFDLSEAASRPGVSFEEMVAYRFTVGAVPDMSAEEFVAFRAEAMSSGRPEDTVIRYRNGRMIASHHRPMPDGGWLATHEDVTARHDAEARIAHMANHDMMTGLANRTRLQARLAELRAGTEAVPAAVLVLDLDRFKAVNDCHGHSVGDALLCAVAERLRGSVRGRDLVVRLGGDEFAIVQADVDQPMQAEALARRVLARIGEPFELGGLRLSIGVSIGIAVLTAAGVAADVVLNAADIAMYRAKAGGAEIAREASGGGGRFTLFQPEMAQRSGRPAMSTAG